MSDPIVSALRDRMNYAETAEEVAKICYEATRHAGGPFYCACGAEYRLPPLNAAAREK